MLSLQNLDACIAVVPVDKISELGIKLLRKDIPCVVEKPLGSSLADAAALRDAAQSTQTLNMVSVNRRFMPFLNRAIEWTRTVGAMRYVRCTMARHARSEPSFLRETAVHAVDALRHVAGDVAEAEIRTIGSSGTFAQWYAIELRFENGISGRIDILPTAGMLEETYEIVGEGFRASINCPFGIKRGWRGFRENKIVIEETADSLPEDVLNGCYDEAAALVETLARGARLRPTIEDVFPSVELCFSMEKSAKEKKLRNLVPTKN
jgi:predicted dehydrogenase